MSTWFLNLLSVTVVILSVCLLVGMVGRESGSNFERKGSDNSKHGNDGKKLFFLKFSERINMKTRAGTAVYLLVSVAIKHRYTFL